MAVDQADLPHPQGQLPIGMGLAGIDQHTSGAVHGLDGKVHVIDDRGVHIILVVVPVTGSLPQLTVEHDRGGDLHIAVLLVDLPPVVQQGILQGHALGQEEGEAGALVPEHEQAQLLAQLPVVPLFGLLNPGQIFVQLVLFGEGDAVDALESLPVGVPPPVSGVAGGKLQGVALNAAGGVQVGAGAQVGKLPLLIEGDDRILGQVMDELYLVWLALLLHELNRLRPGQLKPLQLQLLLADLPHLPLDLLQMLRGKGEGGVHVVVPALVDRGTNGQLHLGPQPLNRLGHHMGTGMPVGLAVFGIFKGIDVFFGHFQSLLSRV